MCSVSIRGNARAFQDVTFQTVRRVNVHGDEFNSVAFCNDGRNLVIGTEKGDIILSNTPDGHVIKRLKQQGPVHAIVVLGNDREIVAGGGDHSEGLHSSLVRKWNLDTGTFVDWPGLKDRLLWSLCQATQVRA